MRRIWAAWASAILPQPTMPTLSMLRPLFPTGFEVPFQPFRGGDPRRPAHSDLQFLIAVTSLLPIGVPAAAIEDRGQLLFRPSRVPLPHGTQGIAGKMRHVDRREPSYPPLVQPQELAARRKQIVDHVKGLTIDARSERR